MVHKSDLRHNSYYLYKGELYRHDVEKPIEWIYTEEYVVSLDKIKISEEIFDLIKADIREILDESFRSGVYAQIILPENYKYYTFIVNQIKLKDIYYLHEVQNLIFYFYDKELKINDKKLSNILKLAHI